VIFEEAFNKLKGAVAEYRNADSDLDHNQARAGVLLAATRLTETEPQGWRDMESAPTDGTRFLAAIRVERDGEEPRWRFHEIAYDDVGCERIDPDFYEGLAWEQYERWAPLPVEEKA
jgi:hypothetical protein